MDDPSHIDSSSRMAAERANAIAGENHGDVREIIGFLG
jgi:hypothetical protein